jgi:hypothetical protein
LICVFSPSELEAPARPGLFYAEEVIPLRPFRVKTGKPQCEHMFSALPPKADVDGPAQNHNLFDIAQETGKLVDVTRGRCGFFRAAWSAATLSLR